MSTSYIPYSFGSESYRAKVRCSYLDGMSSTRYKDSDCYTFYEKPAETYYENSLIWFFAITDVEFGWPDKTVTVNSVSELETLKGYITRTETSWHPWTNRITETILYLRDASYTISYPFNIEYDIDYGSDSFEGVYSTYKARSMSTWYTGDYTSNTSFSSVTNVSKKSSYTSFTWTVSGTREDTYEQDTRYNYTGGYTSSQYETSMMSCSMTRKPRGIYSSEEKYTTISTYGTFSIKDSMTGTYENGGTVSDILYTTFTGSFDSSTTYFDGSNTYTRERYTSVTYTTQSMHAYSYTSSGSSIYETRDPEVTTYSYYSDTQTNRTGTQSYSSIEYTTYDNYTSSTYTSTSSSSETAYAWAKKTASYTSNTFSTFSFNGYGRTSERLYETIQNEISSSGTNITEMETTRRDYNKSNYSLQIVK